MAEREVVVTLRLDNAQGIRNLGALKAELIAVSEKLKLETAIIKENGFATKTNERNVGTLIARQKALSSQIRELSNDLSGATAAGLRFRDKMADAARSGLGAFGLNVIGVTAAIGSAVAVLRDAGRTIIEFQQSQANLAAILGKSRKEITALTDSAARLGPALGRAPKEVTALQTELAKLGFTEGQVMDAQEAVIQLANATGETLGRSAEVAASTLKGFGLEATDTQRLVDVMAQSFNSTALDLEKFGTAMSIIGPVSKTAGVSLEETTAIVGVLADRGVDASTIGTSLRDIFIDISQKGLTLNEALGKINGSTDKVTAATELFGKRSATTALILADNVGKLDDLEAGLLDVAGVAQKVSDEQLSTLNGSFNKLGASWDAFILSLDSGDGVISRTLKGLSDVFSTILTGLADIEQESGAMRDLRKEFDKILSAQEAEGIEEDLIDRLLDETRVRLDVARKAQDTEIELVLLQTRRKKLVDEIAQAEDHRSSLFPAQLAGLAALRIEERGLSQIIEARGGLLTNNVALFGKVNKEVKTLAENTSQTTTATDENTKAVRSNTAAREDALDALIRQNEEREKLLSQPVDRTPLDPLEFSLTPDEEDPTEGQKTILDRRAEFLADYNAQEIASRGSLNEQLAALDAQYADLALTNSEQHLQERQRLTAEFVAGTLGQFTALFDGIADLAGENQEAHKAASVVSALVNTYLGVTQALGSLPPPASYVAAAATLAQGLAAVKKIQGFREGGFTSRRGSDSVPVGVVHANEFVASAPTVRRMRPLFEWLDQYQRGGRPPRMPYQDGGFVAPTPTLGGMVSAQELGEARAMELSPMVSVEEINRVQQRVAVIERLSSR